MRQGEIIELLQRECDLLNETIAGLLAVIGEQEAFGGSESDDVVEAAERLVRARDEVSFPICAKCGYGRTRHVKTRDLGHEFVEQEANAG